jgi:uncharacterized protein
VARSVLLQLVRDSIQEVIEAKRTIDKHALLNDYPILAEPIKAKVKIYLNDKLRCESSLRENSAESLLEEIIYNAKAAAFQDAAHPPLTTAEYLHCSVELALYIPKEGGGFEVETSRDGPIIKEE